MHRLSISHKRRPLNASPWRHDKRNFKAAIGTVVRGTYCRRIHSPDTQTLSQVHFFFATLQTLFHHNRLVAICLIHFVIINKCHWLRSGDKSLCQSFLLYGALFRTCHCRGKLHIIITRPFLQRCYECLCVREEEREKGLTRKMQLFWRSLYYTWKDAFSEASWELHTGNRFVFSSNSSQLFSVYKKIRPHSGMRLQFQWELM